MFQTKNAMPEKIRKTIVGVLQGRLAAGIDLMQQAKQAHWNVKGVNFIALHQLFDKVHEETAEYVDLIAERIAQLGGIAEGTCKAAARNSILPDYSLSITDEMDHVHAVSGALAAFGELIRAGIDESDKLGDKGTADVLTEISRGVDKNLWFVESHCPSQSERAQKITGVA